MSTIRRAYMEISNGIRGLRLHREQAKSLDPQPTPSQTNKEATTRNNCSLTSSVLGRQVRGHKVSSRLKAMLQAHSKNAARSVPELWQNEAFLMKFFNYFTVEERPAIACVCKQWRDVLYHCSFWVDIMPVLNCKKWNKDGTDRNRFYKSLETRRFDSICFFAASDSDIADFVNNYQSCRKSIRSVGVRCSNVTDSGLDMIFKKMACIYKLELSGCNDITETGLWSVLNPKIVSLSVSDCINVADDTLGAISQLLPSLCELNLQAYHVTDTALSFFSAKQSYTVGVLRLRSCWEITNHGIVNIVHSLPNLTVLSLSGCSKISDDGVELIAENLKKLRVLDLSWCPKLSDASLEYIACDLGQLEELVLDRCSHVTDIGVGYLSTMTSLVKLYLRWCRQIRDFGLQHVYSMRNLRVLSVAGCTLLSSHGLSGLVSLRNLEELELTNCPGASTDVCQYLKDNNPRCLVIE